MRALMRPVPSSNLWFESLKGHFDISFKAERYPVEGRWTRAEGSPLSEGDDKAMAPWQKIVNKRENCSGY